MSCFSMCVCVCEPWTVKTFLLLANHTLHAPNELEFQSQIACLLCTKFTKLILLIIIIIDSTSSCSMFNQPLQLMYVCTYMRKLKAKCYRNDLEMIESERVSDLIKNTIPYAVHLHTMYMLLHAMVIHIIQSFLCWSESICHMNWVHNDWKKKKQSKHILYLEQNYPWLRTENSVLSNLITNIQCNRMTTNI